MQNTMPSFFDKASATLKRLFQLPTLFVMPSYRAALEDLTIEVYVSRRKLPFLAGADAIIVPVGPDLKMVFGVAKMVRDYGADIVQHEANKVAPLPPGEAFVGTGAKYRYRYTALAVIFDNAKRPSPEYITQSVVKAVRMLRERGARSVVFPDMTENLLAQPNWITAEQRRETAKITARLTIDAILACGSNMKKVKIWCWVPENAEFFIQELKSLHQRERSISAGTVR
jgi:O-acetyl-ADP-ribose deacetylase (regulator of RNase III)